MVLGYMLLIFLPILTKLVAKIKYYSTEFSGHEHPDGVGPHAVDLPLHLGQLSSHHLPQRQQGIVND
jgi:hypothetical protein